MQELTERFITEELRLLFEERNRLRAAAQMQEAAEVQLPEPASAYSSVFIFMPDLAQVLDAAADDGNMGSVMETLIMQGSFLGIYLAGCLSPEERPPQILL